MIFPLLLFEGNEAGFCGAGCFDYRNNAAAM
jgi:hypothetical protein